MNENTHGEWAKFFQTTNHMLAPYEECDCSHYNGRVFEHRRYHDVHNNISVTYIMYRGYFVEGSNDTNSLWATDPQASSAPLWSMPIDEYLQSFKPSKVDFLVANVGFFPFHESVKPAVFMHLLQGLSNRVVWKTTTAVQHETPSEPHVARGRCECMHRGISGTATTSTSPSTPYSTTSSSTC